MTASRVREQTHRIVEIVGLPSPPSPLPAAGEGFLVAPPLVVTPEQVDRIVDILRESIPAAIAAVRS